MTLDQYSARKKALDADMARYQAIILQSNTRASGIAQLLAAILTLVGVATALAVNLKGLDITLITAALAWFSVVGLLISLFGLVSVKWPRLGRMSRDKSVKDYERRIKDIAEADQTEYVLDYEQAFDLQKIVFIKERSTQFALVGMLMLSVGSVAAFVVLVFG